MHGEAVNLILTLMRPTLSPPPSVPPRPHHLPHALAHSQLDLCKIGKECASNSFISQHVVQTDSEF